MLAVTAAVKGKSLYNRAPLEGLVLRAEGPMIFSDVTQHMKFEEDVYLTALVDNEERHHTFLKWYQQDEDAKDTGKSRYLSAAAQRLTWIFFKLQVDMSMERRVVSIVKNSNS